MMIWMLGPTKLEETQTLKILKNGYVNWIS